MTYIFYILLFMLVSINIVIKSKKNIHMLQQHLYNENNRYIKWIKSTIKSYINLELLIILVCVLANKTFALQNTISIILNIIVAFIYGINVYKLIEIQKEDKKQEKKPLVITARVKRLIITIIVLYLIPAVISIITKEEINILKSFFIIFVICGYLNSIIILIANFINKYTLEKCVYYHYKNKAVRKLRSMTKLKVIGITGSYGKTSSKNILADILNIKYATLPDRKSVV